MTEFLSGAIMMGFFVAGLFFWRFWLKTRDWFFALFAVALWLLAAERLPLLFIDPADESRSNIFFIRLFAYWVIFVAILYKNKLVGNEAQTPPREIDRPKAETGRIS